MAKSYVVDHNATVPELAIIVAVCEGIVNSNDEGLGGGFQAVIYNGYCKDASYLDAVVSAPQQNIARDSQGWGIGIPAALKGYERLYTRDLCGMKPTLKWNDLFTKNIQLAQVGWNDNGRQVQGKPELAKILETVAKDGPSSSLYQQNGDLHKQMMDDLEKVSSKIESKDLTNYNIVEQRPFRYKCFNYAIATTRIPGSGSTISFGCQIVEAAYPRLLSMSKADRMLFMYHTLRFMLSMKPLLRSKHFNLTNAINNAGVIADQIISQLHNPWKLESILEFGKYQVQNVTPNHIVEPGVNSIIIKRGKVSIVMSNNRPYPDRKLGKNLGSYLNNQLYAFDLDSADSPNRPLSMKRPQSQISSVILYSKLNNPVMLIGGSIDGDSISAMFNILFEYFINGKNLKESIQSPYCAPKYEKNSETIVCDNNISNDIKQKFDQLRLRVEYGKLIGGVVAASTIKGQPEGVTDSKVPETVYIDRHSKYGFNKVNHHGSVQVPQQTTTEMNNQSPSNTSPDTPTPSHFNTNSDHTQPNWFTTVEPAVSFGNKAGDEDET